MEFTAMARDEVTGKKPAQTAVPAAWYSLKEFAAAHRLSEAMLFKLKAEGRGPRETAVGSRRFVTFEDAAAWRAAQKEATAA
jgi:hypothetical protein